MNRARLLSSTLSVCACAVLCMWGCSEPGESSQSQSTSPEGGVTDSSSPNEAGNPEIDAPADWGTGMESGLDSAPDGAEASLPPDADDAPSADAPAGDATPDAQESGAAFQMPDRLVCPDDYAGHTTVALTGGDALTEVSGIVASLTHPDLLWMHNDSGSEAVLMAATVQGLVLGRVLLQGVTPVDWEDIAAGPCPDGTGPCLWVADTGNNTVVRDVLTVYVIREPQVGAQPFADLTVDVPWTLSFRYPGTPVDVEAVVVSPDGSALWLFEKVDAASAHLYALHAPFDPGATPTVEDHGAFACPGVPISKGRMITAGDLHPSGERLLLRVYTGIYEYRFGSGQSLADLGTVIPNQVVLGPFDEPQGEAVGYDSAGSGFWSISEANGGAVQPLHHYACNGTPTPP